jgi:hypothetical protein
MCRLPCDESVELGGCGEEFAEEEGVLCAGCELFLCFGCFGKLVVNNECQVRYASSSSCNHARAHASVCSQAWLRAFTLGNAGGRAL